MKDDCSARGAHRPMHRMARHPHKAGRSVVAKAIGFLKQGCVPFWQLRIKLAKKSCYVLSSKPASAEGEEVQSSAASYAAPSTSLWCSPAAAVGLGLLNMMLARPRPTSDSSRRRMRRGPIVKRAMRLGSAGTSAACASAAAFATKARRQQGPVPGGASPPPVPAAA